MLKQSTCFTFVLILSATHLKAASLTTPDTATSPRTVAVAIQGSPVGRPEEERPLTDTNGTSPPKPAASAAASSEVPEEPKGYKLTFKNLKDELEHCEAIAKLALDAKTNRPDCMKLIDYAMRQDPIASAHAGFIHMYGDRFVPKNSSLAYKFNLQSIRWLLDSSHYNNEHAQFFLGHLYEKGGLLEINVEAAERLYIMSAKKGFGPAQIRLGELYESGGFGRINLKEADHWFTIAATNGSGIGNGKAQFRMGLKDLKKDRRMAAHWFKLAHKNGIIEATHVLAAMHLEYKDVLDSVEEAIAYAKDSAHQGCVDAMFMVGQIYAYEKVPSVPKNEKEALAWFKAASDAGHPEAKKKLEYYQKHKKL